MDNNEFQEKITMQLDFLISLVGRMAINEDKLIDIITKGSKKPDETLKAYNLCDGVTSNTKIAKKVKTTSQAVGQNINKWDKLGVVLKIKDKHGKVYARHLYPIKR